MAADTNKATGDYVRQVLNFYYIFSDNFFIAYKSIVTWLAETLYNEKMENLRGLMM